MDSLRSPGPRTAQPARGFVQHEQMLLLAGLLVVLAVVIPQALKHGWRGALLALGGVVVVIAAGVGILIGLFWLSEQLRNPGTGLRGWVFHLLGHLLRFALFALLAVIILAALLAEQGLGTTLQNGLAVAAGLLGGVGGCFAHGSLGPARFWVAFRRFGWALLGSFVGGILGLLIPGRWGIPLGILLPLLVFVLLVLAGRIVPRGGPTPSPSE